MLKELIKHFENRASLPVEVPEVSDAIIAMGIVDSVHFVGVPVDALKVRGSFYQFTHRPGLYAEPELVTIISYNENDEKAWQRVACCKELIHIFDRDLERTDEDSEVSEFLDKLIGPLTTEDFSAADIMAAKDRIALYQCLPLLLPAEARRRARKAIEASEMTHADIAEIAQMPLVLVQIMLTDEWDSLNGALEGG